MDCFPEFTHILINEILKIRNILNIILVGLVTRTEVSSKLNTRGTVLTHRKQVQEAQRDGERESFATVLFLSCSTVFYATFILVQGLSM